ncbi:uncharacterized protein LOC130777056 [Actinidia eriantha]|uniref:uncharacterized protein LOC130777056 n=1 Tax=Actinidia eriantha TaxID=165200 RepID=UPI0025905A94|nr:uncharacterized protein LOC130777056 [Actinidia eriantha]
MEIEINGSSSPISYKVLDNGRDESRSHRKLEFENDDDFLNMDVLIEDEEEEDESRNSVHATGDINLAHSKIPNEAIPKLGMKFMTEEAAYQFYNTYVYKVGFSVRRSKEHKDNSRRSHRNFSVAQAAQADMENESRIAPSAIVEFMGTKVDTKMMADYTNLGDVICFDITYRKNKDGRLFAMFVGVNHHKQITIFGAALLYDEIVDSFVWLFDTFANTMCGKTSKTILTDQDAAMAKALVAR